MTGDDFRVARESAWSVYRADLPQLIRPEQADFTDSVMRQRGSCARQGLRCLLAPQGRIGIDASGPKRWNPTGD